MYVSPISMYIQQVAQDMCDQQEKDVLQAVMEYGVEVDREELIKALEYDREQYKKGYADGRADAQKWISVEERLPEVDARYGEYEYSVELLVYDGLRRRAAYYCHTTKLWHDSWYEDDTIEVTHWMPLPEQPKEVKDA